MPVDQRQVQLTFQRLDRQLRKTSDDPAPENIHHLRTNIRRIEALLDSFVPEPSGNQKKLLKSLGRLRKKAGRIRDLDVHIAALDDLKIDRDGDRKAELVRSLAEQRAATQKKLTKALRRDEVEEVRKRLKRASATPIKVDPVELALSKLSDLRSEDSKVTEASLHQHRIAAKRARYIAEFAGNDPQAKRLIEALTRMQDVIGDWHDWLTLAQKTQELLAGPEYSPLLATLRRITAAKYRSAINALSETRTTVAELAAARKPPRREPAVSANRAVSAVA